MTQLQSLSNPIASSSQKASALWHALREDWTPVAALELSRILQNHCSSEQLDPQRDVGQFFASLVAWAGHTQAPSSGHMMRLEILAETVFAALDWPLSEFRAPDKGQQPNDDRQNKLSVATEPALASPLSGQKNQSSIARLSPNSIFVLAPLDGVIADFSNALEERQFDAQEFRTTELLCKALETVIPGVLVIHARLLRGMLRIRNAFEHARIASKVIAYSHERDVTHRLLAMRAGAVAFFEPPIDSFKLIAKIEELLGRQQTPPYRVMICDGDRAHGVQCGQWLMNQGMVARLVFDLKQVVVAANEFRPDIALVDFDAAEPRGFELIEMLNQMPELNSMTIVAFSNQGEEVHRMDAITAGADDFLIKPLKARHVIGLIKSRMQRMQRLLGQAAQYSRDARLTLHPRERLLEQLSLREIPSGSGLLLVLLDRTEQIRETLGLSGLLNFENDLARALRAAIGQQDILVQLRDFCFAVLAQREQREQLNELAEHLRRAVGDIAAATPSVPVSLSIGAAHLHEPNLGADQRIAIAEGAAIAAQRIGGNRVLWFEPRDFSVARADQTLAIRAVLQKPLSPQNLRVRFRPLVPLCGKLPDQFDFQYTLVSANDDSAQAEYASFYTIAIELGILRQLETDRIEHALRARHAALQRQKQLRLFLPFCSQSLCDTDFLVWIVDRLRQANQSGTGLVFELNSDDMLDHCEALKQPLKILHKCGVRIGCNDFGANFAAIHVLNSFPLDFVRLHPDLVQTATSANVLSGSLITLVKKAHQLGAAVIAPKVEALERAHVMMRLGIDYGVGDGLGGALSEANYDFNRPLW